MKLYYRDEENPKRDNDEFHCDEWSDDDETIANKITKRKKILLNSIETLNHIEHFQGLTTI